MKEIQENSSPKIKAEIVSNKKIKDVKLKGNNSNNEYFVIPMKQLDTHTYEVVLDNAYTKKGFLHYNIVVSFSNGKQRTFPADKEGDLYDWNFYERQGYTSNIVSVNSPIYLMQKKTPRI